MTASSVRIMKEVRLVAWPAAGVTVCAALALVMLRYKMQWGPINSETLTAGAFFAGLPLLAGLGIGSEFQYRTLMMTLAQPIERHEIWRVKNLVASAIIALPALLFSFGATSQFADSWLLPLLYVVTFSAAAFPMTLIARSSIGGAALNALATAPVFWGAVWAIEYSRSHGRLVTITTLFTSAILLSYAAGMVLLGRRMFICFQAAEGMQSVESALPGADLVPAFIADAFRCRPSGVVLNLVRRELRLLRLVWPLTFLLIAAWTALIVFHIFPIDDAHMYRMPLLALTIMISVLIALLSGSLSLGEERTWGTHDWQLTLPLSSSSQWGVKLAIGISISVFCGALVPMAVLTIAHKLTGNPQYLLPHAVTLLWPADMAAVTLLAFWAACMVKGTAKASMLAFPALGIAMAGAPLGNWAGDLISMIFPRLLERLVASIGVIPAVAATTYIYMALAHIEWVFVAAVVVCAGVLVLQSHRLFREQGEDRPRRIIRRIAPIFILAFSGGLLTNILVELMYGTFEHARPVANEMMWTVERATMLRASPTPFRMDADQAMTGLPLSQETRDLLAGSSILIVPGPPYSQSGGYVGAFGGNSTPWLESRSHAFTAVIRTPRGSTCLLTFRQFGTKYGGGGVRCV